MTERIEEELKRALNRTEPPEGFADRVMARIRERATTMGIRWWYAAVAAVIALIMVLTTQQVEQRRRTQARETERQVVFALALVAEKLDHVNAKLQNSARDVRVDQKQEKRYE